MMGMIDEKAPQGCPAYVSVDKKNADLNDIKKTRNMTKKTRNSSKTAT